VGAPNGVMGKKPMRMLSTRFMDDLVRPDGWLNPLLVRIQRDQTLMLAIRGDYVNIYYRGGNLLRLERKNETYRAFFDPQYDPSGQNQPHLPNLIKSQDEARQWVMSFPALKQIMDEYLCDHNKPEREFQQLVARENNFSTISNESEYFVSDIEFADTALSARFDLLAIRWMASQRTNGTLCRAALFEMKYGDDALAGSAGLLKHLQDIDALIQDTNRYNELLLTMASQFEQLDQLGLLQFNRSQNGTRVKLDAKEKPEVVFILANHNPRSTKLKTILSDPQIVAYEGSAHFDLRFYVASFAGYGLHAKCMLSRAEFEKFL
jgi:hypothetical protein